MTKMRTLRDYLNERLKEPAEAAAYLAEAFEDYKEHGNMEFLLLSLRSVAEAQGGVATLAKNAHMSRQSVHKILSAQGNPTLASLNPLLHGLGVRLAIVPLES